MSMYDNEVLDALKSIAKGIGEQNDILNRLATMYEKSEKLKLGVLTPNEAFPEYKELMEKHEQELYEVWKHQYELTPSNSLDRLGEPQKLRDISGPL